jgi:hypothetical protein
MTESDIRRMDSTAVRQDEARDPLVRDGFDMQDLGASEEVPPAYGEVMNELQLSQAGFDTTAVVAGASIIHGKHCIPENANLGSLHR